MIFSSLTVKIIKSTYDAFIMNVICPIIMCLTILQLLKMFINVNVVVIISLKPDDDNVCWADKNFEFSDHVACLFAH